MIKRGKTLYIVIASIVSLLFIVFTSNSGVVQAETEQEKIERLSQEISQYEAEISKLKSQASTLSNQIAQYDAQIRLTTLKITQTEEKILLLGGRITQLEGSLQALTKAFSSRVVESYKITRLHEPFLMLVTSPSLKSAFTSYRYLEKIQQSDGDLMLRLENAQVSYQEEKVNQEDLQAELNDQKNVLGAQKSAKATLLEQTRNDEEKYQDLLRQAKAQLAAFRRFISSQGGATILSNQTKCDSWGCYYNQRDSEWGNYAIGNSDSSVAEYGCLITSMAMISTHYDKNLKPSDIASTPSVFFGDTAYMIQGSWGVNGVNTNRNRVCWGCETSTMTSKIDSELSAGRPVIVGLFGGPDHFIVLKAKNGDDYVMNDPFLENGGDVNFSNKYSIEDISTVDYVTVN